MSKPTKADRFAKEVKEVEALVTTPLGVWIVQGDWSVNLVAERKVQSFPAPFYAMSHARGEDDELAAAYFDILHRQMTTEASRGNQLAHAAVQRQRSY